jgi:hypothetical protein
VPLQVYFQKGQGTNIAFKLILPFIIAYELSAYLKVHTFRIEQILASYIRG